MKLPATTNSPVQAAGFGGLEVVAFESRRAKEIAALILNCGGNPRVAPSMREILLTENSAAFTFAEKLFAGQLDAIVFTTGVGTRWLVETLQTRYPREKIVQAFSKVTVVARGPKPVSVLRELSIPVTISIPEPNTWREIIQELDEHARGLTLKGSRIAIQEYGVPNEAFLRELNERDASVLRVPVYRWALPEELQPLREALKTIVEGRACVVLFTNATQVEHVLRVADEGNIKEPLLDALRGCVICSVGPTCSEALSANGIPVDLEPGHPKMGALVYEAAKRAPDLLRQKTSQSPGTHPKTMAGARFSRVDVEPASKESTSPGPSLSREGLQAEPWRNSRFMKACRLEPTDATPVWFMRQAGRYMKEYRDLRARVPFLELCKNPDLATEVTLIAAQKLRVDAAIMFADLLLIVEPLGLGLEYGKDEGPVLKPVLRESGDVDRLCEVDPQESLSYLYEAIRKTRAELDPKLPLIGFGAAPFTLASYIIEGGASKSFRHTKSLMYRDPGAWRALMEHLVRGLARYINLQVEAGVQAVQVFDTWIGCLGSADYEEFVLPHTRSLLQSIAQGVPVIHFGVGAATLLKAMRSAGGNVIGLDYHVELDRAWAELGEDVGVQGNLDPMVLYADLPYIRRRTQRILDQAGGRPGHIFNLGHGILPDTPEENVTALVEIVHEMSNKQRVDGRK